MLKRSKKQDNTMMQYYLVIGAFVVICVGAVLYVLLNPKKSFAQMPVIDESQILVHNGQTSSNFQQGTNSFFTVSIKVKGIILTCHYRTGLLPMPSSSSRTHCQTHLTSLPARQPQTRRL
jgi:hypothetical protein